MIESEFILTIIEITIEGEKFENQILEQLNFLSEKNNEYTGVGIYTYLQPQVGIEKHQLTKDQLDEMFGIYNNELTKFELINVELNILADVTMNFRQGIIDNIEIFNKLGEYPTEELLTYQLRRIE